MIDGPRVRNRMEPLTSLPPRALSLKCPQKGRKRSIIEMHNGGSAIKIIEKKLSSLSACVCPRYQASAHAFRSDQARLAANHQAPPPGGSSDLPATNGTLLSINAPCPYPLRGESAGQRQRSAHRMLKETNVFPPGRTPPGIPTIRR